MEVKMELSIVRAMAEGTPCLYINQEFQQGEAPVVIPPAPNAFALSQNNKEASFMDYSFSTYLMWHLNASSIASYFNSAQIQKLIDNLNKTFCNGDNLNKTFCNGSSPSEGSHRTYIG
ncbi:uncharacterized protein [Miscanthus floridulus]|uniref:uncharacterized protein n=1 Tax=Miscanthus floridulus TaxID=154761 RepID=UPI003459C69B